MFFKRNLVLLSALTLGAFVSPAKADVFFAQDPVSKLSVAYPDTWRRVYNQKTDDTITLAAPGVQNFASCRLRVRDDKRYQMYPAGFNAANNRDLFDETFWKAYLAEYPLYRIDSMSSDAGLSRNAASRVEATYISFDDPRQQKQAVIYASLYNGHIYIVDCSAKIEYYQRWFPDFMGIIKSVDFRKEQSEFLGGEYRDIKADSPTYIRNQRYNRVFWWDGLKQYW